MKIEIITTDGSPLGVTSKTVWGDGHRVGVGGAELALLTMCEEWSKRGDEVVLYNNPYARNESVFEQRMIGEFDPNGNRDILIVFRSPSLRSVPAKAGKKIWWSCDQNTIGNFKEFSGFVDKIVVISPFHQKYFSYTYGITNTVVTDLPVRKDDYKSIEHDDEKSPYRALFSSVPDRGLESLWRMWPLLKREIPEIHLVITSDYRLWGANAAINEQYRIKWSAHQDFKFLGAIPRERLIHEQWKAGMLLYPCTYDELFCIACSEAQWTGAYPITTSNGSLATTNMGTQISWDARDPRGDKLFASVVKSFLDDPFREQKRKENMEKARKRFDPATILAFWDKEIFN